MDSSSGARTGPVWIPTPTSSNYATDFFSDGENLSSWTRHKKRVNAGKTWQKSIFPISAYSPYPSQPDLAVVTFEQEYASSNLSNRMKKRQYWVRRDNRWQIAYEGPA